MSYSEISSSVLNDSNCQNSGSWQLPITRSSCKRLQVPTLRQFQGKLNVHTKTIYEKITHKPKLHIITVKSYNIKSQFKLLMKGLRICRQVVQLPCFQKSMGTKIHTITHTCAHAPSQIYASTRKHTHTPTHTLQIQIR